MTSKIINYNFPICKNCINFIKSYKENDFIFSKCKKFGEKNLITGDIDYQYADICRESKRLCGLEGKYFFYKPKDIFCTC